jgi:hypothetical protein
MAPGSLKSLENPGDAPARRHLAMLKKLNTTNHISPTQVGAFILPSVGRVSLHQLPDSQACP